MHLTEKLPVSKQTKTHTPLHLSVLLISCFFSCFAFALSQSIPPDLALAAIRSFRTDRGGQTKKAKLQRQRPLEIEKERNGGGGREEDLPLSS